MADQLNIIHIRGLERTHSFISEKECFGTFFDLLQGTEGSTSIEFRPLLSSTIFLMYLNSSFVRYASRE